MKKKVFCFVLFCFLLKLKRHEGEAIYGLQLDNCINHLQITFLQQQVGLEYGVRMRWYSGAVFNDVRSGDGPGVA